MPNLQHTGSHASGLPLPKFPDLGVRRLIVIVPSLALALAVVITAIAVLSSAPRPAVDWVLLVPFTLVMAWECFIVWQLVLGFVICLRGEEGRTELERRAAALEPVATGRSRTALLVPIHEEDSAAVFARLRIVLRSVARLGPDHDIDVHVLSDTRTEMVATAEQAEWERLDAEMPGPLLLPPPSTRTRVERPGISPSSSDRRGSEYDFAIVLDADSLMSGGAIRRLIRLMEERPRIGLIQTVSYATGRDTLFARIQQFAVRLYAPLSLRGLEFWQGPEGSYWGHNAIIRIAPFRQHCRLPILPGAPTFRGRDLVPRRGRSSAAGAGRLGNASSARVRRHMGGDTDQRARPAGAGAALVPGQPAAYAGSRFSGSQGRASRGHLALGIGGYLVAPLWWCFLILGAFRVLLVPQGAGYGVLAYGLTEPGLSAGVLAAMSVALILLPRVLNLARALSTREIRRSFGGAPRLLFGAGIEQALWVLLGPLLALVTAGFVGENSVGRYGRLDEPNRVASDAFRSWTPCEPMRHPSRWASS